VNIQKTTSTWDGFVGRFGGTYDCGPLGLIIVDQGMMLTWRSIIKWEWRHRAT
jgi:hypothetical protein